jgi:hypothetical protein
MRPRFISSELTPAPATFAVWCIHPGTVALASWAQFRSSFSKISLRTLTHRSGFWRLCALLLIGVWGQMQLTAAKIGVLLIFRCKFSKFRLIECVSRYTVCSLDSLIVNSVFSTWYFPLGTGCSRSWAGATSASDLPRLWASAPWLGWRLRRYEAR